MFYKDFGVQTTNSRTPCSWLELQITFPPYIEKAERYQHFEWIVQAIRMRDIELIGDFVCIGQESLAEHSFQ